MPENDVRQRKREDEEEAIESEIAFLHSVLGLKADGPVGPKGGPRGREMAGGYFVRPSESTPSQAAGSPLERRVEALEGRLEEILMLLRSGERPADTGRSTRRRGAPAQAQEASGELQRLQYLRQLHENQARDFQRQIEALSTREEPPDAD
jgi:hypothetical protein